MDKDREDRIRRRAYSLWEEEGRPHGRHEEHWRRASDEVDQDPEARSLGSAAQSDLIPPKGRRSKRAGSLVDTGPGIGLVAGTAGTAAGLGNLSVGQEEKTQSSEPGGMSSIGADEAAPAKPRRSRAKAKT